MPGPTEAIVNAKEVRAVIARADDLLAAHRPEPLP
jgi:hypothetical protein